MRVRNKELRQRRHRKEQTIKAAIKDAKVGGVKKEKKVAAPKPAAKPAAKKTTKKTEEATAE
jgi:hypothetical protein